MKGNYDLADCSITSSQTVAAALLVTGLLLSIEPLWSAPSLSDAFVTGIPEPPRLWACVWIFALPIAC